MFKYVIFMLAFLFAFAALGAETEASFNAAYEAAEQARKKAASLGHEWRDTRKILKNAKAAAKKGDYDKAVTLANEARFEGEAAAGQAALQEKIWQDAVPKLQ